MSVMHLSGEAFPFGASEPAAPDPVRPGMEHTGLARRDSRRGAHEQEHANRAIETPKQPAGKANKKTRPQSSSPGNGLRSNSILKRQLKQEERQRKSEAEYNEVMGAVDREVWAPRRASTSSLPSPGPHALDMAAPGNRFLTSGLNERPPSPIRRVSHHRLPSPYGTTTLRHSAHNLHPWDVVDYSTGTRGFPDAARRWAPDYSVTSTQPSVFVYEDENRVREQQQSSFHDYTPLGTFSRITDEIGAALKVLNSGTDAHGPFQTQLVHSAGQFENSGPFSYSPLQNVGMPPAALPVRDNWNVTRSTVTSPTHWGSSLDGSNLGADDVFGVSGIPPGNSFAYDDNSQGYVGQVPVCVVESEEYMERLSLAEEWLQETTKQSSPGHQHGTFFETFGAVSMDPDALYVESLRDE